MKQLENQVTVFCFAPFSNNLARNHVIDAFCTLHYTTGKCNSLHVNVIYFLNWVKRSGYQRFLKKTSSVGCTLRTCLPGEFIPKGGIQTSFAKLTIWKFKVFCTSIIKLPVLNFKRSIPPIIVTILAFGGTLEALNEKNKFSCLCVFYVLSLLCRI